MRLFKKDIIVSVDVEATGTSPTTSSCVMVGCVAMFDFKGRKDIDPYKPEEWLIDRKAWCIKEQPNRPPEKDCWENFWLKNMNVWEHIQKNAIPANEAMLEFDKWYRDLDSKYNIKIVCKPTSFDWQWINCLYDEFGPSQKVRLPFSCMCLSTMFRTAEMIGCNRDEVTKFVKNPVVAHTHFADDDAYEQGYSYLKMCYYLTSRFKK